MGKTTTQLIFILVLAFLLRLVNLNQSFWLDEGAQMVMSSQSLVFQWLGRSADFHPPLFYLLIHFWMKLGSNEWFLRLPSIVFSLGTVYLGYLLGKKLFEEKIGLLSGLFLAIGPFHIYYSQEARMYSLFTFLVAASMYFLWNKNWLRYLAVTVAMFYTHYASFAVIFAQFLWFVVWQRKSLKPWLVSFLASILFFLPWLPQFLKQLNSGGNLIEILPAWKNLAALSPLKSIPLLFFKFSLGNVSFGNKVFYFLVILIIFLFFGFLFWQVFKKISTEKVFVINWLLAPILVVWLISFVIPMFQPFRLLFTIVPFYLLLAVGVYEIKNRLDQKLAIALVFLFILCGLGMYYLNPKFQREDWRGATAFIESQDPESSVAIFEFSAPFAPYQWYTQNGGKAVGVLPGLVAKRELVGDTLPRAIEEKSEIFLFEYLSPLTDPEKLVTGWLESHGYRQTKVYDFSGVGFVYNYSKRSL